MRLFQNVLTWSPTLRDNCCGSRMGTSKTNSFLSLIESKITFCNNIQRQQPILPNCINPCNKEPARPSDNLGKSSAITFL